MFIPIPSEVYNFVSNSQPHANIVYPSNLMMDDIMLSDQMYRIDKTVTNKGTVSQSPINLRP